MMKKFFAMILAALLFLSLVACGEKTVDNPQQNEGGHEKAPTLEEILCNDNWYYVGLRTPVGLDFNADGTVSGGTWTLNGTTLDCVWKNGTATRFEIRTVNGAYFMTDEQGLTLYHYGTKPEDWNLLALMPIQVLSRCWEDHLEVVCVDGQYRRGKSSCKHIPLQVIQHYGIVLTEFICRYYTLVRDSQVLIQ
jgi:hypothetical protein